MRRSAVTVVCAIVAAAVPLLFSGCSLEIPQDDRRGGIEIYTGRLRLTDGGIDRFEVYRQATGEYVPGIEMIVRRNQQFRATSATGHQIEWISSDVSVVEVDRHGLVLVGQNPGMTATITATSTVDPSLRAEVTIWTRALR